MVVRSHRAYNMDCDWSNMFKKLFQNWLNMTKEVLGLPPLEKKVTIWYNNNGEYKETKGKYYV